jgi:hypothetical protein
VAARTTLNAKNLEALGPGRLAELLIEISSGNAAVKRRLRLELARTQSPGALANGVRKWLSSIARSQSFVDWKGIRALADDLDTQRRAIVETVAEADPSEALDLLWRFMALAPSIFERCDDGSGTVIGVFHEACGDIGDVALMAEANPTTLADQAFAALIANDYGQFDQLIAVLAPALGQTGLEHLKQRMVDLSNRPPRLDHRHRSRCANRRGRVGHRVRRMGQRPHSRPAVQVALHAHLGADVHRWHREVSRFRHDPRHRPGLCQEDGQGVRRESVRCDPGLAASPGLAWGPLVMRSVRTPACCA